MAKSRPALSLPEFIALMGMTFATVAFSIDAMLPAMSAIAAELTPGAPNRAQLIITSFVLGMGIGTLFTGPLSDTFGRKPVILGGAVVYIAGAMLAWAAESLETVLLARVLQGLGAAGPRIAALAIVRDLYSGRVMARVMSFAMMVFALVPAIAPMIGAGIIALTGWRGIFLAFVLFALTAAGWLGLRQPETLPHGHRRPFSLAAIGSGLAEMLRLRQVTVTILILTLVFGMLFATLSTVQMVFDRSFDAAASFPYWFGAVALVSALGSLLNARIVVRVGMRQVVRWSLLGEIALTGLFAVVILAGVEDGALFYAYVVWILSIFMLAGLTIGNLNALGMEPLGHLAGLAASVIGSVSTVGAVLIAVPIGLAFDGTPLPVAVGILICAAVALLLMRFLGEGEIAEAR